MCEHLKLTYWCISQGNHKVNSDEKYYRLLKKTQTITGTDRGSHDNFIQDYKTSQYVWKRTPIDDTDIPRSLAAIGREFRFNIDVEISATPTINPTTNSGIYNYLCGISNDALFAQEELKILIEELHTLYRECHNSNITPTKEFKVGDIVKANVQVQSNSDYGTINKLIYQVHGPFKIIEEPGNNPFHVQRLDDNNGTIRKYTDT